MSHNTDIADGWEREGEDYGYTAFYKSVDAITSGSTTYEQTLTFGAYPYPGKPQYVFAKRPLADEHPEVTFVADDISTGLARIEANGHERIWLVGGGALIQSFLQEGHIDEYIISSIPVLLGKGIPLFPSPAPEFKLELLDTQTFPSGLVQTHYRTLSPA